VTLWQSFAVLGALAVLAGCDARTEPIGVAGKRERPVHVQRVSLETVTAAREFVGVVRARYETDLAFRVAGKITARLVNVGDRVRAGDIIARLDPQDLKLQMESAQAELAAATSTLEQAKVDYDRYITLSGRGFAASADVDRRKTTRDEADGRLRRAQRALDLTRNQLDYSDLKADADGVITTTMAEAGQVVAIGQAVARLAHGARRKPSSHCRRPGWRRRPGPTPASGCGPTAAAPSRRGCASLHRPPIQRPVPTRRASPFSMPTTASHSA